jgi:hypothetical protein
MFQRFAFFFCTVMALVYPVSAGSTQILLMQSAGKKTNSVQQSSIGGVNRSMSAVQVQRLLGKPLQRRRLKTVYCGDPLVTLSYTYRDLQVELYEDHGKFIVDEVTTTGRRYRSDKGIRVGDSIEKAKAAYPSLHLSARDGSKDWFSIDSQLLMTVNDRGEITKIKLGALDSSC